MRKSVSEKNISICQNFFFYVQVIYHAQVDFNRLVTNSLVTSETDSFPPAKKKLNNIIMSHLVIAYFLNEPHFRKLNNNHVLENKMKHASRVGVPIFYFFLYV